MKRVMLGAALLLVAAALVAQARSPARKTIELKNAKGQPVGTATLSERDGVTVRLDLRHLPPGEHGLHFHEHAACEGPDFKSAGGHFNPGHKEHGAHNAAGPHAGDLPNITVGPNGRVQTTVRTAGVTLAKGERSLLGSGGTALVIHAKADDLKTNPAGNSGERIACGVIRP